MLVRSRKGPMESKEGRKCPHCGEWNELDKDACWNCNKEGR